MKSDGLQDLRLVGKAAGAVSLMLWGVFPIFVLGWFISAVIRHPVADIELRAEGVYQFIVIWQGGIKFFPPIFLLIILLLVICAIGALLQKTGHGELGDGMGGGRIIIRKFLVPALLSAASFTCGVLSGSSLFESWKPFVLFIMFVVFAILAHYVSDATESASIYSEPINIDKSDG